MDHKDSVNKMNIMQAFEPAPDYVTMTMPEYFDLSEYLNRDRATERNQKLQSSPNPRTQFQMLVSSTSDNEHRLPVINTPAEIASVNDNPGMRIVLHVTGGFYSDFYSWYYGQTNDGQFYKQSYHYSNPEGTTYYLDGPLDPNVVCFSPDHE
jgi:hypothetical protein